MTEKAATKTNINPDLIRTINARFDENFYPYGSYVPGIKSSGITSSGITAEVIELKGRLIAGIKDMTSFTTYVESPDWIRQENFQLRRENKMLRQNIQAIEKRLVNIEATIPKEKVVILREISKEEAEKEIIELFTQGQILYYSDIAERLGFDLKMVVDICNELQTKGEIEVVDDTLQRR